MGICRYVRVEICNDFEEEFRIADISSELSAECQNHNSFIKR